MNNSTASYTLVVDERGTKTCNQVFDTMIRPLLKDGDEVVSTNEWDDACTFVIRPDPKDPPPKSGKKTE